MLSKAVNLPNFLLRDCEVGGSAKMDSMLSICILIAAISLSLDDEEINSLRAWDGFRSRPALLVDFEEERVPLLLLLLFVG